MHVHNQLPGPDATVVPPEAEPTYVRMRERPSPGFSGNLYSWRDHYHPLFKRIVPYVVEREARARRWLVWLTRLTLWAAALAALTTVGCHWLGA